MFILRSFLTASFALAFAASVFAAPGIEGTVVNVRHNPVARNAGWITLRHRGGLPMTFGVDAATRIRRLGRRSRSHTPFRALHRGERIRVLVGPGPSGAARVVEILPNTFNRSSNRHVRGYHHRRHHVYRRAVWIPQRTVVRTVRHRPAGHSRPHSHHRRR